MRPASLVLLALAALLPAGCGGGDKSEAAATTLVNGCRVVEPPKAEQRTAPKPTRQLADDKTYDWTLHTNCGSFTIRLDQKAAPNTTASLVSLTRRGFYDGTTFHRIVPGFVIQGGDPTAQGDGGPGYQTLDKPPANVAYTHGVVAMAKTADEPPGTGGSQFFVVTADDAQLTPDYSIVGKVVDGLGVVDRIGRLGDPATEQPTQTVEIEKATVKVS
jgi:peptidyl-prolyl cis-trans isomerase B (cyclophilin B)